MEDENQAVVPQYITEDDVKSMIGKGAKGLNTQRLAEQMNLALSTTSIEDIEYIRSNMLSYADILIDGKYKPKDYANAVIYCSYKIMGFSNQDAYKKTFPDRWQRLYEKYSEKWFGDEVKIEKSISAHVAGYNSNFLVNKILEQTLIPGHIIHAPLYHDAILELANLMKNAKSEFVRYSSANALADKLKMPEVAKVQIDVTHRNKEEVETLQNVIRELATKQREAIISGVLDSKTVAEQSIIEVEEETI